MQDNQTVIIHEGIKLVLTYLGRYCGISEKSVFDRRLLNLDVHNDGEPLKWITVDVCEGTFELDYNKTTWFRWNKKSFHFNGPLRKGGTLNCEDIFINDHSEPEYIPNVFIGPIKGCKYFYGVDIYKIYGEYDNGKKLLYVHRPDLMFNGQKSFTTRSSSNCSVTTAAFGNPQHPMVIEFRNLRDQVLVNFPAGREFIDWYNRHGPEIAVKLERSPAGRRMARCVLTPLATTIKAVRGLIQRRMPKINAYLTTPKNG